MNRNLNISIRKYSIWLLLPLFVSCGAPNTAKKTERTKITFSQLSPEQQRKYNYFFLEAASLKVKEQYDAAFDLYKHCLEINPEAPSALYEIGQFYIYLGQTPLAQEAMEKAARNDPENYWYQQALAGFYQEQNKTDDAIRMYEKMLVSFSNQVETLLNLLNLYGQKKDHGNEIFTLNRLEYLLGKNEQISMEKFRIYLAMGDNESAFHEIESLVKEYPLDMRYLTVLGDTYMQNGRMEEAYAVFQKVLSVEPNNAMTLLSIANYYEKTGQTEKYDEQIDLLLVNKNVPGDIKLNIMQYLINKAETQKMDSTYVINQFNRVIEQDMDDTKIPMLYAQYLFSKKMEKESVPVLEHILQLDPENTVARMTLLSTAIRKEDPEWVIRIAKPGVEVTPDVIDFYFYLGMAYFQKERFDEALNTYKTGLQHMPANTRAEIRSDFYSIIGDIYHSKKEIKEMYAAYDSALIHNPDNIGALNNYAYYLSLEEYDLDKAEEMSYKTVKAEPKNSTFLDTYAWVLFMKGKYSEAQIYIDDAIRNGGDESDVVVEHAGDIYFMNGDMENALYYWQKSRDMGNESNVLKDKIRRKKYLPNEK